MHFGWTKKENMATTFLQHINTCTLFEPMHASSHIFQRDKKIPDYFCNIIIQLIVTTPFAKVPYEGPKRQERYLKPINNNKYNLFKDLFVSPTIVNIHWVYINHLPTFFAGNTQMSFLLMVQQSRLVTKSLTTLITGNWLSVSNMFF